MVVLAQALVSEPRFVIIDELSLGLAPVIVQRLIPTIRSIAEAGAGVLLIEQFATLALGLANRAYVMEGGRIQYSGEAQELREHPELLHSAYLLRGRDERRTGGRRADLSRRMSVTEIEHVLVLTSDIERTREFYSAALGLRVGERPPLEFTGYWLYAGGTPCLHIADRASYRAHAQTLGLDVPASPQRPDRSTTSRSRHTTTTTSTAGSPSWASSRSAMTFPGTVRASCSSTTRTACGSRSTSRLPRTRQVEMTDAQTANAVTSGGRRTKPPFRADHVGSLLRPKRLLEARDQFANSQISAPELRAIEDDAIREIVQMQRDVGLQSATDGEFRRASWHMDFIYQLGGVQKVAGDIKVQFHNRRRRRRVHAGRDRRHRQGPPRPHDLRRRLQVPAERGRRRRDAEADDPVAEHGPLPRRPGGARPERVSGRRAVLG